MVKEMKRKKQQRSTSTHIYRKRQSPMHRLLVVRRLSLTVSIGIIFTFTFIRVCSVYFLLFSVDIKILFFVCLLERFNWSTGTNTTKKQCNEIEYKYVYTSLLCGWSIKGVCGRSYDYHVYTCTGWNYFSFAFWNRKYKVFSTLKGTNSDKVKKQSKSKLFVSISNKCLLFSI